MGNNIMKKEKLYKVNGLLSKCCSAKCLLNIDTMYYICTKCNKKCKVKNENT